MGGREGGIVKSSKREMQVAGACACGKPREKEREKEKAERERGTDQGGPEKKPNRTGPADQATNPFGQDHQTKPKIG